LIYLPLYPPYKEINNIFVSGWHDLIKNFSYSGIGDISQLQTPKQAAGIKPSTLRDNSTYNLQCTSFLKLGSHITTYHSRYAYSDLQVVCFRNWSFTANLMADDEKYFNFFLEQEE
jgi:hypothetical protein